jgi:hypothetical protein
MTEKNQDLQILLNMVLPFARPILEEHGEFYPFGAFVDRDGRTQMLSADASTEHPAPVAIVGLLTEALQAKAQRGECRAVAICYNGRTKIQGKSTTDAIIVHLERDSLYMEAAVPYTLSEDGSVRYGEVRFSRVAPKIAVWKPLH